MRILILFLAGLLLSACNNEPTFRVGQMPECDAPFTKNFLKRVVDESPAGKQNGLKIIEVGATEDYAGAAASRPTADKVDTRFCKVRAFTNAGEGDIHFVLKWIDPAKTKVWLEITVSTI